MSRLKACHEVDIFGISFLRSSSGAIKYSLEGALQVFIASNVTSRRTMDFKIWQREIHRFPHLVYNIGLLIYINSALHFGFSKVFGAANVAKESVHEIQ